MKKLIYTLIVLIGMMLFKATDARAQEAYGVGSNVINLGVGFGYTAGYGYGTATPVLSGSFEHGVAELGPGVLGLGGIVGYQGNSYSYSDVYGDNYKDKWTSTMIAVRGTYHPDVLVGKNYDVYGALQLGFVDVGFSETYSGPRNYYHAFGNNVGSGLYFGILAGGRYYFTDNIGAFAELGWDYSFFKLGLAIKFGQGKK